jgi:hypothetical protein
LPKENQPSLMHVSRFRLLSALMPASAAMAKSRRRFLFCMTEHTSSIQSFLQHAHKIDLPVPTSYSVDDTGLVWGGADELVLQSAREHQVPVMPIIINASHCSQNQFWSGELSQAGHQRRSAHTS